MIEEGKYYRMRVIKTLRKTCVSHINTPDQYAIVFFKVSKVENSHHRYRYKIYSNNRITMDKKHKLSSSLIGTWSGKRLLPSCIFTYEYRNLEEIEETEFIKRVNYAKFGL